MPTGYGQHCPFSLAAELLCQRWTLLVVSRFYYGCSRFNEIHRGVPRMSPSLLSTRLSELERAGIIRTRSNRNGPGREYHLTDAGRELQPLIEQMAVWGQRWARDMIDEDLDPAFLVWSMHLRLDARAMPPGRTVVELQFSGAPADSRQFWLVHREGTVEMCLKDPELDVDLLVTADLRRFVEAWRGFRDMGAEIRSGRIKLFGPKALREGFPDWLQLNALAHHPRLRAGREKRLSKATAQALEDLSQ
ncbi:MAG: helix-turn-helix transcriptional regulator [Acidobacteriota bacterium]|nr:helix-turn-helix transcriptional regulator [Acidobacteriota bacterium]MDH3525337.1 helix-turn-helix transcriptional regulator [Acidobacteriota bacterium]